MGVRSDSTTEFIALSLQQQLQQQGFSTHSASVHALPTKHPRRLPFATADAAPANA